MKTKIDFFHKHEITGWGGVWLVCPRPQIHYLNYHYNSINVQKKSIHLGMGRCGKLVLNMLTETLIENVSDNMSDVLNENVRHQEENVGHVLQKTVFHIH